MIKIMMKEYVNNKKEYAKYDKMMKIMKTHLERRRKAVSPSAL